MYKYLSAAAILCILSIKSFCQDSAKSTSSVVDSSNTTQSIDTSNKAVSSSNTQTFTSSSLTSKPIHSSDNVYRISWAADAPITGVGLGLSVYGLHLIQNKSNLTEAQANAKNRNDVNGFDRASAGFYSESANNASYIPFFTSFGMPLVFMAIDKNERSQAGKITVMYVESLSITAALYTITAGSINRSRPLVYPDKNGNFKAPLSTRESKNSQRSFYAGHTAATASASFFAAKVFNDLNPDSKFKPFVWVIAAALPAVTGYYRYKSGEHFLSDNIIGYVIGGASGILVPQLHKTSKEFRKMTFAPAIGQGYKGIDIAYRIN